MTQADIDAGSGNTATATGGAPDSFTGDDPTDSDTATNPSEPEPSYFLTKSGEAGPITAAGQELDYTITFTNTGNITLTDVEIVDDDPVLDCRPDGSAYVTGNVAPGEVITCVGTYTATQADVDLTSDAIIDEIW